MYNRALAAYKALFCMSLCLYLQKRSMDNSVVVELSVCLPGQSVAMVCVLAQIPNTPLDRNVWRVCNFSFLQIYFHNKWLKLVPACSVS